MLTSNHIVALFWLPILVFSFLGKKYHVRKMYRLFILTSFLTILYLKGLPFSFLFIGTIFPLLSLKDISMRKTQFYFKKKVGKIKRIIIFLSFLPLYGAVLISSKYERANIHLGSPEVNAIGEVLLLLVTLSLIFPFRKVEK